VLRLRGRRGGARDGRRWRRRRRRGPEAGRPDAAPRQGPAPGGLLLHHQSTTMALVPPPPLPTRPLPPLVFPAVASWFPLPRQRFWLPVRVFFLPSRGSPLPSPSGTTMPTVPPRRFRGFGLRGLRAPVVGEPSSIPACGAATGNCPPRSACPFPGANLSRIFQKLKAARLFRFVLSPALVVY
jgi:hypothetical protein